MNRRTFLSYLPGLAFLGLCQEVGVEPTRLIHEPSTEYGISGSLMVDEDRSSVSHTHDCNFVKHRHDHIIGSLGEDRSFKVTLSNIPANDLAELLWNTPAEYDGLPIDEVIRRRIYEP